MNRRVEWEEAETSFPGCREAWVKFWRGVDKAASTALGIETIDGKETLCAGPPRYWGNPPEWRYTKERGWWQETKGDP